MFVRALIIILIFLGTAACDAPCDPALASLLSTPTPSRWDRAGATAPDGGCVPLRNKLEQKSLGRAFPDVNAVHLRHAKAIGINPVTDVEQAWNNGEGLERVRSDQYIYIDSLSHSYPMLVPSAAQLLATIGRRFHDTLQVRGGGAYRPKVTSLLRTESSMSKLRRVNRNAGAESAHCYGTTFDISYSKFICDDSTDTRRTFEDLKNLLAEIVEDLRQQGRCVVKHERHQACLHITVCADNEYEIKN